MFLLSGYEYFLGFLLIAAAVPILALVTNLIVAPKGRTGERKLTYESGMEPIGGAWIQFNICLLYTSPSPRDRTRSRMPSSA